MTGSIEGLIPAQERAIRLSPRDPQIGLFYSRIGCVHLLQSRTDEAIVWCEKARNAAPAHPQFRIFLASAYALKGDTERAAAGSPKHADGSETIVMPASPACGPPILGGAKSPRSGRNHLFRRPAQGRSAGGMNTSGRIG